jgi:hypothetical protein
MPPLPPTRNETFYRSFQKEGENVNEARMTSLFFGPYKDTTALYVVKYGTKETVVRIRYTGVLNRPPHPLFDFMHKTDTAVSFDASRSFDPENDPLTYEWDFGDDSPITTGVSVTHEYLQIGEYAVRLIVTDTAGNTQQDLKTVKIGEVPFVNITSPAKDDLFSVGTVLRLRGEAFDAKGNRIPDDQLEWEVRQHHAGKFIINDIGSWPLRWLTNFSLGVFCQ